MIWSQVCYSLLQSQSEEGTLTSTKLLKGDTNSSSEVSKMQMLRKINFLSGGIDIYISSEAHIYMRQ